MIKFRKYLPIFCVFLILFTYSGFYGDIPKAEAAETSNKLGVDLSDWVLDESNGYIYGISSEAKKLLFIRQNDLGVEKEISFEYSPSDIEMADGKLYIPITNYRKFDNYVKKIVIVDIASKNIEKTIATQNDSYKVAVDGNKLFYAEYDQHCYIYVYDLSNNTEMKVGGSFYQPDITVDKNNHILYIGESGSSGCEFTSMRTSNFEIIKDIGFTNNIYRKVVVDSNSAYFGGLRYDPDKLGFTTDYREDIICAKGNYLFSASAIYNRDTGKRIVDLPYNVKLAGYISSGTVFLYDFSNKSILKYNSIEELNLIKDIVVDAYNYNITAGSTHNTRVTASYSDGRTIDVTKYATYQFSDDEVAKIDLSGIVTGLSAGTTYLSITYQGKTKTVEIMVPFPDYNITDWVIDEEKGYIYAVSDLTKKLLFIRTSDMKIEKKLALAESPTDIEIANGKLYIPLINHNSSINNPVKKIVIVDIATKNIEKTLSTQSEAYTVAVDGNKLFYISNSQWCDVYAYNMLNDTEQKIGSYYYPKIDVDRKNHILYIGESGSKFLSIKTSDYTIVHQSTYNISSSGNLVYDSGYIYYAGRRVDPNLNVIKEYTIGSIIYVKGQYVFTPSAIYDRDTGSKLINLQPYSISFALMDTSGIVYIYNNNSKEILKYNSISSINRADSIVITGTDICKIPTYIGDYEEYRAQVKDQYGNIMSWQTVTWAVYDSANKPASSLSIFTYGNQCNLLINRNTTEGNYTLIAKLNAPNEIYTTKNIQIYQQVPTKIKISEDIKAIPITGSVNLTLSVDDQYNNNISNESVVWSVYDSQSMPVSFLNIRYNQLTVYSNARAGSYVIKAEIESKPSLYTTKNIMLTALKPESIDIIGEKELILPLSGIRAFVYHAFVRDSYGKTMSNEIVTWTVVGTNSEEIISNPPSISPDGILLYNNTTTAGYYKIRATSVSNSNVYNEFLVRIIKDSALNKSRLDIDKVSLNQFDITIAITKNANALIGIRNSTTYLKSGTHYIESGNRVIIKKEYLASLPVGTNKLIFDFDAGKDAELILNVLDNTNDIETPSNQETESLSEPKKEPDVKDNISVKVTIENNDAKYQYDENSFKKAYENAKTESDGIKTILVESEKIEGAKSYTLELPAAEVTADTMTQKVEFKTEVATVVIPGNMIKSNDEGKAGKVSLTVALAEKSELDAATKSAIGDRPLLDLSLMVDGKITSWENSGAPVVVSIPYTPTAKELTNPEKIVVWYLDFNGTPVPVPNGKFDPATNTVTFKATHFSKYAIVYSEKSYADLASYDWAKKEIEVLAAKGIINGTSQTTFNPEANITRADFMLMLVKTFGLTANVDSNFSDINESDYYYNAVGIARKLGISGGTGDNKFNPKAQITRQEMMTLLAKVMIIEKKLKTTGKVIDLNKFRDIKDVSEYAIESIATLVKEGMVSGQGEILNPLANTTRAEAAVLLYKAYNK